MRSILTLLFGTPLLALGQSLVSTMPQDRTALLEDFTGIHCGYCPDGHAVAAAIKAEHQNDVVIVGVHAGPYAVPSGSEPDFRTSWGTEIDAHFTISGYPAGVINRHLFDGADDLGRGAWAAAVDEVLGMSSPVNVGVASSFDPGSRDLTVTVELLYTGDSPGGSDYISVLLKESHIIGWQTDYGPDGDHTDYDHTNVLRAYLTDTWGDEVTTTTAGTSVTRTYTLNVPAEWDIANCEVVAFASEYQSEVYQAREVKADGGTTLVFGTLALQGAGNGYGAGAYYSNTPFHLDLTNVLGASGQFLITLEAIEQPGDWNYNYEVYGIAHTGPDVFTLPDGAIEMVAVNIMPGPSAGIGHYRLTIASVDHPAAPILEKEFKVISGVTDMVMSNPGAEAHEPIYLDGLASAGNTTHAKCSRTDFQKFAASNALSGVANIYYNVSWTFPCLDDATVAILQDHMDNGGDLMICGQDIGWDQSGDAAAYGTPVTQAFYQQYMLADFIADGSTSNNQVDFIAGDEIFGALPGSAINSVFGTNSYPEEISPLSPAVPIFTYNLPTKIGGLRALLPTHRVVYSGIGMEQFSNVNVAHQMVALSHDWFNGLVSVEEFDAALADLLNGAYPVPADASITLPLVGLRGVATFELMDLSGRTVIQRPVSGGAVELNTSDLPSGIYTARLTGTTRSVTRSVEVMH
jgi:hypothetical protein